MACLAQVAAKNVEIAKGDDGETIRLRFMNADEDAVEVFASRSGLSVWVDQIRRLVGIAEPPSIYPAHLGGPIEFLSHDVRLRKGGNVTLSLHLRTDDGIGSLSLEMSPETARGLARDLTP